MVRPPNSNPSRVSKGKSKKIKTREEERKDKEIRARRRFKSAVRFAINNLYWLQETDDKDVLGADVKKNIHLLLQRKRDKHSLLTREDKLLLGRPPHLRSKEDCEYLSRLIGTLNCFSKYPAAIQEQLAAATLYQYIKPDKVIYKQDREALALYFIINGEVAVFQEEFDPVFNRIETEMVGTLVSGTMFGELAFLHDIPRTTTNISICDVEVLVLLKEDFERILRSKLQETWDKVLNALDKFDYFSSFTSVDRRECCLYSGIKKYRKDQILIGLDKKATYKAFFIIRGQCKLIETLPVIISENRGIFKYSLFDYDAWKVKLRQERSFKRFVPVETTGSVRRIPTGKSIAALHKDKSGFTSAVRVDSKDHFIVRKDLEADSFEKVEEHIQPSEKLPPHVTTIFMQICTFDELSCFSIGEDIKNRHVVAVTPEVECLVIPKYWLLQKNVGNRWSTIAQYLNKQLPCTQELFKIFVNNRAWEESKIKMINSIVNKQPCNSKNNVPLSIRLKHDIPYNVHYH